MRSHGLLRVLGRGGARPAPWAVLWSGTPPHTHTQAGPGNSLRFCLVEGCCFWTSTLGDMPTAPANQAWPAILLSDLAPHPLLPC
ncbi:MAG: hypothetical protein J3K34DRAFT_417377 [Monoraphidium minutum]|nr:MAG: hypothetical protein J3K34DRAFT_417377 [Monoraphidium minutum]